MAAGAATSATVVPHRGLAGPVAGTVPPRSAATPPGVVATPPGTVAVPPGSAAAPPGSAAAPPGGPVAGAAVAAPRTTRVERRRAQRRHVRRGILAAVVAAALVIALTAAGGTVAAMTKTVTIAIDGATRQVTTLSDTVDGALAAAHLQIGPHDTLAPAGTSEISDGSRIVVRRGRLVSLTIDGRQREFWTTATTVDGALAQIGRNPADLRLSADRSREIPLTGLTLTATTVPTTPPQDRSVAPTQVVAAPPVAAAPSVTLTVGLGAPETVAADQPTVGQLLAAQHINLGKDDTVSPGVATPLRAGLSVTVTRIAYRTSSADVAIPQPKAVTRYSDSLDVGIQEISGGHSGTRRITYRVTVVNGRAGAPVQTGSTVVLAAEPAVTVIGRRQPAAPASPAAPAATDTADSGQAATDTADSGQTATGSGQTTTPSAPATFAVVDQASGTTVTWVGNRVFFHDNSYGVNWDGLARCESTNNPKAVNPSGKYFGLFQFDLPTWRSAGGTGNPIDASPAEQLLRAKKLFLARGLSPWACAWAGR